MHVMKWPVVQTLRAVFSVNVYQDILEMAMNVQVREDTDRYVKPISHLSSVKYIFGCHCMIVATDLNECGQGNGPCDKNAHCKNTEGSYECQCYDGFQGNGYNCTGILYMKVVHDSIWFMHYNVCSIAGG